MRRWWYKRILIMFVLLAMTMGTGFGVTSLQEQEENQQVSTKSIDSKTVIPGGVPIGIYMEMDGVLVLATECIECVDGNEYEPAKNLVKSGDYIVGMNGETIDTKKDLIQAVSKLNTSEVILTLRREEEYIDVKMQSVQVGERRYKLGIWVKDNVQGLGTLTFVTTNSEYGALGHGIHDTDTEELLEISEGTVYETNIIGVQKGQKGEPGGLEGVIIYNRYNILGTVEKNTENGIYGKIENIDKLLENQEPIEICEKDDIKIGDATIRCTVDGTMKEYDIKIKNVDYYTGNVNKGIVIEVVDEELLELTGGIVQGMSGSPILQNGKIIGAVTHVLVNDPTRGYGIFIEDMLKAED
ncbi:MAG: SpoIVB peptidase [Faecalimonas sp.]|nr:SpoIVB peptidase [Faecalimonas sp.]